MTVPIPEHVACIMDGSAHWPRYRDGDRPRLAPEAAFNAAVDAAIEAGVQWLTLLPPPGPDRPELLEPVLGGNVQHLHAQGVRIGFLDGEGSELTDELASRLRHAQELTAGNATLHLTTALAHDGRQALLSAARTLVTDRGADARTSDQSTVAGMAERLRQGTGLPHVDLLVRTGGRHRLSGALPWHCADAELIFLDVPWPDFTAGHFRQALELYRLRRSLDEPDPADATAASAAHIGSSADPLLGDAAGAAGPLRSALTGMAGSVQVRQVRGLGKLPIGAAGLLTLPAEVAVHLLGNLYDTARFTKNRLAQVLLDQVTDPVPAPESGSRAAPGSAAEAMAGHAAVTVPGKVNGSVPGEIPGLGEL